MTTALIAASAALFLIFLLSVPFPVNSHTSFSAKQKFVVENVELFGFLTIAFSVRIEDGRLLLNGKRIRGKKERVQSKASSPLDTARIFANLDVVSARAHGGFGNASDAASTALITHSIIMILNLIKNTILPNIDEYRIDFVPLYGKTAFDLDLKIRVRINAFHIIFTGLKILKKEVTKWH